MDSFNALVQVEGLKEAERTKVSKDKQKKQTVQTKQRFLKELDT